MHNVSVRRKKILDAKILCEDKCTTGWENNKQDDVT